MAQPPAVYPHGQHESVVRSYRWRTVENSAAYLADDLRAGATVLDVGCGPGSITADIAERVAPGRVVAVDASADAVAKARQAAAEQGVQGVEFAVADAHALDGPDDTFDVVHAHQVLQYAADPVRALSEMRRVCRPGGIVGARDADHAMMGWYPEVPELTEWMSLYQRIARRDGGEPNAGRRLLSWARCAGLTDITCTTSTWCYATADERAWWSEVWSQRITSSGLAAQALDEGLATADDLQRIADGWRVWGQADDGWFTIVHGEIRCRV
ncbi:SAM-dependent methyltransferase [Nocardiopsis gilva YIM 90087]|uniref:SAM-dependent methyltransferase n=1 Tax=Nocardiopsis gilva YIM 90087 TaxID=1235441 RepID=A0A223S736_9ACTN|nr:methyltransferase domain-containing protein [Nocardiopsis gilva]ASU83950.1 SAM-dependent methyltransferase [Nocardiopsis gilva YIM 90087]